MTGTVQDLTQAGSKVVFFELPSLDPKKPHRLRLVEVTDGEDQVTRKASQSLTELKHLLLVPGDKDSFGLDYKPKQPCRAADFLRHLYDKPTLINLITLIKSNWPSVQPRDYFLHDVPRGDEGEAISIVFGNPKLVREVIFETPLTVGKLTIHHEDPKVK